MDLAENRRARFDYEIKEKLVAGIELHGHEVKSVKNKRMGLAGGHVIIRNGEAWLLNVSIPSYQPNNIPENYDPLRTRRLLLKKDEIAHLAGSQKNKSTSLVPLRAILHKNLIKIEIGLGISRKKSDKRELLKKRSALREMRNRER